MNNEELNEDKKIRIVDFTFVITCLICLIPMAVGVILWDKLPDEMVRHMNISMEANGWSSKTTCVFIFPLILLGINIFVNLWVNIARRINKTEPGKIDSVIKYFIAIFSVLIFLLLDFMNLGLEYFSAENTWTFTSIACSLLYLGIGNYLPKAKDLTGINLPGVSEKLNEDKDMWFYVRRKWSRVIILVAVANIATSFLNANLSVIFFMIWTAAFVLAPYALVKKYERKHEE